ncbi:MAG: four helix bundle protein [Richelia sp. RM2_1_2]|nr:four helix bundle protein [Richelia sp. RM2_1_2]
MINNNVNISIQERTENFAIRVVKAYSELNKRPFDDAGKVLSKQFLKSGTSIGANCSEAKYAQSNADFINKYSIEPIWYLLLKCKGFRKTVLSSLATIRVQETEKS